MLAIAQQYLCSTIVQQFLFSQVQSANSNLLQVKIPKEKILKQETYVFNHLCLCPVAASYLHAQPFPSLCLSLDCLHLTACQSNAKRRSYYQGLPWRSQGSELQAEMQQSRNNKSFPEILSAFPLVLLLQKKKTHEHFKGTRSSTSFSQKTPIICCWR